MVSKFSFLFFNVEFVSPLWQPCVSSSPDFTQICQSKKELWLKMSENEEENTSNLKNLSIFNSVFLSSFPASKFSHLFFFEFLKTYFYISFFWSWLNLIRCRFFSKTEMSQEVFLKTFSGSQKNPSFNVAWNVNENCK